MNLSVQSVSLMEKFVESLKPFSSLTDALSGEKTVTISCIYPLLKHIKDICTEDYGDEEDHGDEEDLRALSSEIRTFIWNYVKER